MLDSARWQASIELLDELRATGKPADRIMTQYFRSRRYIGAQDKAIISECFYTLLRHKLAFSWLLQEAGLKPISTYLVAVLVQQRMNERDQTSLSVVFNGQRFAPATLPKQVREAIESIDFETLSKAPEHIQLNIPEWLFADLKQALGEDYYPELAALNQRANTDIRVNTLKATTKQVQYQLKQAGYDTEKTSVSPWGLRFSGRVALFNLPIYKQGWLEVQDQGSQLLALATAVKEGDTVVDFCAGAGGKTLAMAAMMNNKGIIHACDIHQRRLTELSKRAKRAGVHNVRVHTLSSEKDKWVKQHAECADVVLIDAPCSGTGTWRRNPDSRYHLDQARLQELRETQAAILRSAARLVKPGGRLIYATCSLLELENVAQIDGFLEHSSNFRRSELIAKERFAADMCIDDASVLIKPGTHNMDGFYLCQMTKHD